MCMAILSPIRNLSLALGFNQYACVLTISATMRHSDIAARATDQSAVSVHVSRRTVNVVLWNVELLQVQPEAHSEVHSDNITE